MVHSGCNQQSFRDTIRETWGHPSLLEEFRASVVFFVGRSYDMRVELAVQEESQKHGDIVQSGEIIF